MKRLILTVALNVDLEGAELSGSCAPTAIQELTEKFQSVGENWNRQIKADPMMQKFASVTVRSTVI